MCLLYVFLETYIHLTPPPAPADGSRRVAGTEKGTFTNSSPPPAARSSTFIPQFQSSHRASGSLNGSRLLPSAETSLYDAFRTPVAPVKLENVTKQEKSSNGAKVQHGSLFLPSLLSGSKVCSGKTAAVPLALKPRRYCARSPPHPPQPRKTFLR